ncbi:DUF424 family protein, partial [Candidatus Woesearchaeota archaeon]|nr:DUF424 family protein [Candidatus Woesearchaeota archaeon]
MKFSYKIFEQGSDKLLAIADSDLLDKTFSKEIELTISKSFYHDDFCDEAKVLELVDDATIVNA